jgi:hypothetical protein
VTDTEILDYLEKAYRRKPNQARDVEIGPVVFTLNLDKRTIRELLIDAIQRDEPRLVDQATTKLLGKPKRKAGAFDDLPPGSYF